MEALDEKQKEEAKERIKKLPWASVQIVKSPEIFRFLL